MTRLAPNFDAWLVEVDEEITEITGYLGLDDLPDAQLEQVFGDLSHDGGCSWEAWSAGESPREYAIARLEDTFGKGRW